MSNDELVKKIADKKIFLRADKDHLKNWLPEKLVTHFSSSFSGSDLESKVTDTITRTVQVIRSLYQPKNPLLSNFGNSKRIVKNKWRREVIYGIVGFHPELLDNEIQLNLVIERRLKILERMKYAVNRRKRIFRYPSSGEDQAVNPNAAAYWTKMHADVFYLSKRSENPGANETGIENPTNALNTIFNPPSKRHSDLNKLYCQQVATIILMDSLLVIEDTDLLPTLSQINEGYLRIGNPYGDSHPDSQVFFSIDKEDNRALFENSDVDFNDLQLGDHVHIRNHEAYNILTPTGIWQGEHAFISEKIDKKKYKFHGHGFSSGLLLAQMRKEMMKYLRDHFLKAQKKIIAFYLGKKEEDGSSKAAFSNGSKGTLSYGIPGLKNIIRDIERENELPDVWKYACWCIEYPKYEVVGDSGYWSYGKLYFFNSEGDPNRITLKDIPEMNFTTKSNTPFSGKCQVIRPKVG
jgi:hypothetical protein